MIKLIYKYVLYAFIFLIIFSSLSFCGGRKFVKIQEFEAPDARQGVAVDSNYIYVISNRKIIKYDKKTLEIVKKWEDKKNGHLIHLDSGMILNGKLYCAHSNYPDVPMTSSIEIWDTETLEHIDNHSFGIRWGSCTWVDYKDGYWYAAFAQYKKWEHLTGKDASWTTVVKFDEQWNELSAWVFPKVIVEKFGKMSNSGGSFGPDGLLYCTGHDNPELYVMKFPDSGSELELLEILPIENTGQGFAWDRSNKNFIYCINKKERKVIVSKLIYEK